MTRIIIQSLPPLGLTFQCVLRHIQSDRGELSKADNSVCSLVGVSIIATTTAPANDVRPT
jgi:hypothetical protein